MSILISVGTAFITLAVIQYLYREGMWRAGSDVAFQIRGFGGIAVLASFITSIFGIARERPRAYGFLALVLSVFSILLYVV